MQKQSLPLHHKNGTGGTKAVFLLSLAGQQVICKTFLPGDKIPAHQTPTDEFVLVLDGQIDISVGKEISRFVAGDYILIPANTIHALMCLETARLLVYE